MIYGELRGKIQPRTGTTYTWEGKSMKESKRPSLEEAGGMTDDKGKT